MEFTDGQYMTMQTTEIYLSKTVTNVSETTLFHQMECNEITDDVIKKASVERNVSQLMWVSLAALL